MDDTEILNLFRGMAAHFENQFVQLKDVLESHMARQNMLLDGIIFQISITNAALEVMHGAGQSAFYAGKVAQLQALRKQKVEKLQEMINARRPVPVSHHDPEPSETEQSDPTDEEV